MSCSIYQEWNITMNTVFNQLLNWIVLLEMCLLMMLFSTDSKAAGFALTESRICILLKYFPAVTMFVWPLCLFAF